VHKASAVVPLRFPSSLVHEAAEHLRRAVRDGRLAPGEQLPSEPDLARQLGLSRGTLRQAIAVLEHEGLLFRRQGLGTFVAHRTAQLRNELNRNYGVTDLIRSAGMRPGTRRLQVSSMPADERVAHRLGLSLEAPLAVINRTRTADDRPVARTIDYLPLDDLEARGIGLEAVGHWLVTNESLYGCLRDAGVVVHTGVADVTPTIADRDLAEALEVRRGAPLLWLAQVDYSDQGRPVLYSDEYLIPGFFTVQVLRKGPG
jgi:GntR family transcriptional regulator